MSRVLSNDGRTRQTFHYDAHDGQAFISTESNVQGLLNANKFQRNSAPSRHSEEVFNKVASIDTTAAMQWCKTKGIQFREFLANPAVLRQFLNDPDNAAWRTRAGKV